MLEHGSDSPLKTHASVSTPRVRRKEQPLRSSLSIASTVHLVVGPDDDGHQPDADLPKANQPGLLNRWLKEFKIELDEFGLWCTQKLTPGPDGDHWLVFSPLLLITLFAAFVFAMAHYPYWLTLQNWQDCLVKSQNGTDCAAGPLLPTNSTSYALLQEWGSISLSGAYLRDLGGFYAPDVLSGQAFRWFTSQFVHINFAHLICNLILVIILALLLERRFGWWCLLPVWCASVVSGNLWSLMADPCSPAVGASGGIFGLLGLFVCEAVLSRHTTTWSLPKLRLIFTMSLFIMFAITAASQQANVSHHSHLGGGLCGILAGLLLLHRQRQHTHQQKLMLAAGAVGFVAMLGSMLIWAYVQVLPSIRCNDNDLR